MIPSHSTAEAVPYNGLTVSEPGSTASDAFGAILAAVWREACQHIEIAESTGSIASILTRHTPVRQILVRRLDREKGLVETVAMSAAGDLPPSATSTTLPWGVAGSVASGEGSKKPIVSGDLPTSLVPRAPAGGRGKRGVPPEAGTMFLPPARTECSESQMAELLAWCQRKGIAWQHGAPEGAPWHLMAPPGWTGDLLAGPLSGSEGPAGVLLLAAEPGGSFAASHAALAQSLLEPFAAALENDGRLREMTILREAAEADRRSLLVRLGRKELGDRVVGAETGLRPVIERVELVARSDVPVLVLGETGTGKEVIARMIHSHSSRATGPFLRINCGAIPPELIDSQLFGHERGAFTGAVQTRAGWFERADHGTLLLDEVGELPLAAQVRLLRILQDGWLERVGGHDPIHVDVRIVAATHRDLAAMVSSGDFREDLWYRLAVFPIVLPPLRERQDDIPELARHFARRAAARFVLPESMPSSDDIELLKAYAWPGNIRELASVIDRAAILGDGKGLEVAKSLGVTSAPSLSLDPGSPPSPDPVPTRSAIISLAAANRRHIEMALTAVHGQVEGRQGAAALLQVNPHTLRAKMRKLGIDWARFRSPVQGDSATQ